MKTNLKLVEKSPSRGKVKHAARPVTIHYPGGTQGHCVSIKNAINCAQRMMLDRKDKRVNIEVDGFIVADLDTISDHKIVVWWQRGWLDYEVGD